MSGPKLFMLSLVCGIVITAILTLAAFSVENRNFAGVLLWQVVLVAYVVGPGPVLGHDEQGNTVYEGTPVHMLIMPVGLFLAIATYWVISYFLLKARFGSSRPSNQVDSSP